MRHTLLVCWCLALPNIAPAAPPLRAGIAEADVTPELGGKPVYLAGFGHDRKAVAVHDPIMARALVLTDGERKVALASVDVVGLFLANVENVRKELPGFDGVLVSSTHNHEGPDTLGLWGPNAFTGGIDPDYLKRVEAGIARAVREAEKAAKPVTAVIGKASAPELLRDSREPVVKHDELVALRFDDSETGKPAGVVVQWNCHPETLGGRNQQVSADYVGYTVRELRERFGCPVVYFTGTVGGLMTTLGLEVKSAGGEPLKDGTFEKTERYGRLLGQVAAKALEGAKPLALTPFAVRQRELFLPLDNRVYQLGWQIGVLKRPIYVWGGDPHPDRPAEAKGLEKPVCLRTEIGYWKLGELEVAVIPGEIYPELVLGKVPDPADPAVDFPNAPVEPAIYGQLRGKHRMLIGLGNDEIGYILPKRLWDEKPPFGYGRAKAPYGEVNSLGPQTGPLLCEAFRRLVAESQEGAPR